MDDSLELYTWNIQDELTTEEARIGYLAAVLEEDDEELLIHALEDIAIAKGMPHAIEEAGLNNKVINNPINSILHVIQKLDLLKAGSNSLKFTEATT